MSEANQVRSRFKLAGRVQRVLSELEGVTYARIDDEVPGTLRDHHHRGDFLIQALDLRLRLVLMVGVPPADGRLPIDIRDSAAPVLEASPDTDSVVLIYDDGALTSVIVEPFDLSGALLVPGTPESIQSVSAGPDTLSNVLEEYLRLLRINWLPTSGYVSGETPDLTQMAHESAENAVDGLRRKVYKVREKQLAQATLSTRDSAWLADLILETATSGHDANELEDRLRERGRDS